MDLTTLSGLGYNGDLNATRNIGALADLNTVDTAQIAPGATTTLVTRTSGYETSSSINTLCGITPYYPVLAGACPFYLSQSASVMVTCQFQLEATTSSAGQMFSDYYLALDNSSVRYIERQTQQSMAANEYSLVTIVLKYIFSLSQGQHVIGVVIDGMSGIRTPPWMNATLYGTAVTIVEVIKR